MWSEYGSRYDITVLSIFIDLEIARGVRYLASDDARIRGFKDS